MYPILLQVLLAASVLADCYSHDGILAMNSGYYKSPELVSCGNNTNNCCLQNEQCGSNLLCKNSITGVTARQYCSNSQWVGCSNICADGRSAGVSVVECPAGSNVFCCGACDCTKDLYFVDPRTGEVTRGTTKSSSEMPTWWRVDSSAILASQSAASLRSLSAVSTSSSSPVDSRLSSTPTSTTVTSSTPSTAASVSASGLSTAARVGIGIGCAVAAIGVAVLVWLLLRERNKRKAIQEQIFRNQVVQPSYDGGYVAPQSDRYAHAQISGEPHTPQEKYGTPRHELG